MLLKNQTKKNYQTKTGKKFNSKQKLKKKVILIPFLRWYMENWEGIESRKKIYYIPLPYHDDDMTTTFKLRKKMIVICLLKKNQNDMI